MSELVTYELKDTIATIILDDGKMNVMSREMIAALNDALDRAVEDNAVVVLAGQPGVFSAGFDVSVLTDGGSEALEMLMGGFELAHRLLSFPRPVVVACSGHALAMGVFVVLCADYRIGAEGDHKIGANEVAIGLTMPRTAVEICRQRLAPAHFNRATINAEIYAPSEAVDAGFLDRVVPASELMDEATSTAASLAELDMTAHLETKKIVRGPVLEAIQNAMEADEASFRERMV